MALPHPTAALEDAPWVGAVEEEDVVLDPLIQQATELVQQHERASASFLQRRMRLGYPRAARIIDQLEKLGIVGPVQDGGRSREVLIEEAAEE
jgi:S-DNA-T family DNA segregation ATPase FtsK/SpoIIIE